MQWCGRQNNTVGQRVNGTMSFQKMIQQISRDGPFKIVDPNSSVLWARFAYLHMLIGNTWVSLHNFRLLCISSSCYWKAFRVRFSAIGTLILFLWHGPKNMNLIMSCGLHLRQRNDWPALQRRVVRVEPSGRAWPGRHRTRHPDTAEQRTSDSAGGRGAPQPAQSHTFNGNVSLKSIKVHTIVDYLRECLTSSKGGIAINQLKALFKAYHHHA